MTFRGPSVIQFRSPNVSQVGNSYQLQMSLDGLTSSLPFPIFSNPVVQRFSDGVQPYGDTIQIAVTFIFIFAKLIINLLLSTAQFYIVETLNQRSVN